jgi:TPP-dependent pyruvate/acetoin dehydrogenase alpha subunit
MSNEGLTTPSRLAQQERQLRTVVSDACERAKNAPYPPVAALLDAVFSSALK